MDLERLNTSIASMGRTHSDPPGALEMSRDPFVQFGTWLQEAIDAGVPMPNTMSLATASPQGRPSARIVLLKGFDPAGFVFFTNLESRKSLELTDNPQAALVFYWGPLERQVRLVGGVENLSSEETSLYWDTRPLGSRWGAWASPQSRPIGSRRELEERYAQAQQRWPREVPLPPFWGGWRLVPEEMEFWQARPDRLHDRFFYVRAAGGWEITLLAP